MENTAESSSIGAGSPRDSQRARIVCINAKKPWAPLWLCFQKICTNMKKQTRLTRSFNLHRAARRRILRLAVVGIALSGLVQCGAYQLKSQEGKPVILESAGENCRVVKQKGLYSLLFGAVPLNPVDEGELFTGETEGATYRVTDEVTTIDAVLSVLAGWALSLNRRTITVEACEENMRVANPETERKELDRILASFAQKSRAPVVIMKDGQSY